MRASSGSRIPVRTARCSRVAGSQSNASRTSFWRGSGGGRPSMTLAGSGGEAERDDDVGRVEDRGAPVGDQAVRAGRRRAADRARDGHDRDVAVGRLLHREQRATGRMGLHHHHEVRQRGDDAVPRGEPPRVGRAPRGASLRSRPVARTRSHRSRCRAGYTTSSPLPTTPTGRPPASSTPRWAAPSMPRARPETTAMPASVSSRPISRTIPAPAPVHRRVPHDRRPGSRRAREVALRERVDGGSRSAPRHSG